MDDYEFELLRIKAAVCPAKDGWPSPDVQVSIMGDKPTISGGGLHWSALHACVHDARNRVTKAFAAMGAVDDDKALSREGKDLKKKEIANAAVAGFEKAKTLVSARDLVESQMAKWDEELGFFSKPPATIGESVQLSEIRSYLSAMSDNRVNFVAQHVHDPRVIAAVLGAPAFLSGLTEADVGILKAQIAKRVAPEVAEAKTETVRAMQDAEAGWRAAIRQISERGGLGRPQQGIARAKPTAEVE